MPVYPCVKCSSPVDPTTDTACRSCRDKQPLECSRCHKRVGMEEVFEGKQLKTKKPIFCLECGQREQVVKCALCNLSLQRHQGRSVHPVPGAKVYHPRCLQDREKQLANLEKLRPIMALVGLILGALIGYSQFGAVGGVGMAAAFAVALFALLSTMISGLAPK